jgi:hypothetical protein
MANGNGTVTSGTAAKGRPNEEAMRSRGIRVAFALIKPKTFRLAMTGNHDEARAWLKENAKVIALGAEEKEETEPPANGTSPRRAELGRSSKFDRTYARACTSRNDPQHS